MEEKGRKVGLTLATPIGLRIASYYSTQAVPFLPRISWRLHWIHGLQFEMVQKTPLTVSSIDLRPGYHNQTVNFALMSRNRRKRFCMQTPWGSWAQPSEYWLSLFIYGRQWTVSRALICFLVHHRSKT